MQHHHISLWANCRLSVVAPLHCSQTDLQYICVPTCTALSARDRGCTAMVAAALGWRYPWKPHGRARQPTRHPESLQTKSEVCSEAAIWRLQSLITATHCYCNVFLCNSKSLNGFILNLTIRKLLIKEKHLLFPSIFIEAKQVSLVQFYPCGGGFSVLHMTYIAGSQTLLQSCPPEHWKIWKLDEMNAVAQILSVIWAILPCVISPDSPCRSHSHDSEPQGLLDYHPPALWLEKARACSPSTDPQLMKHHSVAVG